MAGSQIRVASETIGFIENHLQEKFSLDEVASALNYSKFHLHREFTRAVGMTIREYAGRRRLTEAARLLVFSEKSILDIALLSGYESQQAFTDVFRSLYKVSPGKFRKNQRFYPLQYEFVFGEKPEKTKFSMEEVECAEMSDMDGWMELTRLVIGGYPCLQEEEYRQNLSWAIGERRALVLRDHHRIIGAMVFSDEKGKIDFLAVHPRYKDLGIDRVFVGWIAKNLHPKEGISMTTFRRGDRADTGQRLALQELGFEECGWFWEYGYPTSRFVLPPKKWEENLYNEI